MIEDLYNLGKSVYKKELHLEEATKQLLSKYTDGEISKASSDFYIKLVSDFIEGKGSTWNQNSNLVLYYLKNITKDMGPEIGNNAYEAALFFAETKGRASLIKDINKIWNDLGGTIVTQSGFESWLRDNPYKKYTENTVYRYVRALDKADEWFGLDLPKPIQSVTNLNELSEIEKTIKDVPEYENINQNHGHGDFSAAFNLYRKYLLSLKKAEVNDWWPSLTEYDPSISKEQWLEILNKPSVIDAAWGGVLSMFYDFGGEATCKQLSLKYGWEPSSISGSCTQFAKYVHKTTGCKLYTDNEKDRYWPILFQGKDALKDEPGTYVWRLRSELKDALKEYDILRFLPKKDSNKPMDVKTIKESLEHIKGYIASGGFSYDDGLIENFYLSLKSKPFVILAGTSGTGKTKLVKLFAEAIGARAGKEYKMVAVRPDWSDSSDLFGHVNLNGKFVAGEILDFLKDASENPEKPYILCLDEMNLARVEYYFSDFLSIIETREFKENEIISDYLVSKEKYGTDNEAVSKYGELQFPANLYIVGTVNMDETTFPFSKKVLDRANTIEFDYVNLIPNGFSTEVVESMDLSNDFLKTKYLQLSQCDDFEYVKGISEKLEDINKILKEANAHIGYRVRDEISFYMLNNKETGLLDEDVAFDYEIMQKILPRIQGSASSVRELLIDLFKYCCGSNDGIDSDATDYVNTVESMASNAKYIMSAKKLSYMIKRYEDDGFTSYWL